MGLICLDIFGSREPRRGSTQSISASLYSSRTFSATCAAISSRGRVYIPQEDLRAAGCSEDDLRDEVGQRGPRRAVAGRQGAAANVRGLRARDYYARAASMLPRQEARRLVAAEIMAAIYRGVLDGIERRDYDVFSEVVRVPRPRRAAIAAFTWMRTLLAPGIVRPRVATSAAKPPFGKPPYRQ